MIGKHKSNSDNIKYYIMKYGKRYFFIDSEGERAGDTCASTDELVHKCRNWGVPLDKISLTPPDKDLVARILEFYPGQEIEPVEIDRGLKGYIEFLQLS